jgi:acyl dehydratase
MYPKFPVNLSNPVSPGDTLTAEVSIVMETSGGVVKAQPSSLGSGGESFSVKWEHS